MRKLLLAASLLAAIFTLPLSAGDTEAKEVLDIYRQIAPKGGGGDYGGGVLPPPYGNGCDASWANYCTAEPNSTGMTGKISLTGSMIVSENDTVLWAENLPAGRFGMFIYGPNPAELPFGDGVLCISPFNPGVFKIGTPQLIDAGGGASQALNFDNLPPGGEIVGEDTWYFQFLHRDLVAGGAGFNLTDGAEVSFCP